MSKGHKGQTCSYCCRENASELGEHVVSKKWFLVEDRANLPKVPSCGRCNTHKSKLENYVLAVLPLGSRHPDFTRYTEEHVWGRLKNNQRLNRNVAQTMSPAFERKGDLLLPTKTFTIDADKINELLSMIVRGLFRHHFGEVLSKEWYPEMGMLRPDGEAVLYDFAHRMMAAARVTVRGNLGRGTFVYDGLRSTNQPSFSMWRMELFGGVVLSGDPKFPGVALTRFSGMTARQETPTHFYKAVA